jgi:Protein of unknown function (DUF4089)
MTPEQVEHMVDANAAGLGVRIAAEHRKGVLAFYALASRMAELVEGLPLTPADEPGSVFTAVPPRSDT